MNQLIHEKYSYCHGRSTINKKHEECAIYLGYEGTELDNTLKEAISLTMSNYLILENKFADKIVNDYYLTLQCMLFTINIAKLKGTNLSKVKYDKDVVKKLYYFKGSM